MTAATATRDDDLLVSQPGKSIIFLSRREQLRLVLAPRYPIYGPAGQKVGEQSGQTVPFRDNRFNCPQEGTVVLEDGRKADAVEILARLRSHPMKDSVEEGFWEVDPVAPPVSDEETERLTEALLDLDDVTLAAMLKQEQQGWQRKALTAPLEKAVARIAEMRAEHEATIAEPEPEPAPAPVAKAKPGPKPKAQ